MLVIRYAACRKKLWRYDKIGPGEVLRCHKTRITRFTLTPCRPSEKLRCFCVKVIGIDKGPFYKMIAKAFTSSGTKRTSD